MTTRCPRCKEYFLGSGHLIRHIRGATQHIAGWGSKMKWKVVIVGPNGPVVNTSAFEMLFPFPDREEAKAHAECLRTIGMEVTLCDERGNRLQPEA